MQEHIEHHFRSGTYDVQYLKQIHPGHQNFDCSYINLSRIQRSAACFVFCVEIAAPGSVIGRPQLNRILSVFQEKEIPCISSQNSFRFGDVTVRSLGMVEIALDTPPNVSNVPVLIDIVPVDVPPLLGLDVLDGEGLYADNKNNRLVRREIPSRTGDVLKYEDHFHMPLTRHDDHLYAKMSFPHCTLYTTSQLLMMHRQFAHLSAGKLHNLLGKAGLEAVDASTHAQLEEIVARCETCQRIKNAPMRFRVSMGHKNVRFNARAYIYIMYLEERPALHIVDEATRFSVARFLPKISTESVWEAILLSWSSVYTELPQHIMVDEGSQFRKVLGELATLHNVNLEKSGIQSHNSIGIGERYHKPLRDTYRKLKCDHPSMRHQLLLALAVKAMNDTLGPEGTVPSALVFGEFPSIRAFEGTVIARPSLAERPEVARETRRYTAKSLAQSRVRRALHHQMPPAMDRTHNPGDKVLLWRHKVVERRIGQWVGPYIVTSYDAQAKIVLVQQDADSPHER